MTRILLGSYEDRRIPKATLVITIPLLLVVSTTLAHAQYKTWNVNLHRTVVLPVKAIVNRTTITDLGYGHCGFDNPGNVSSSLQGFGNAIQLENLKDPQMSASDMLTMLAIPPSQKSIHSSYEWCGLGRNGTK